MSQLGKVLAILRLARGLSQEELAKLSGIRSGSISDYECGRMTPGLKVLEKLLQGLGCSLAAVEYTEGFLRNLESDPLFRTPQAKNSSDSILAPVSINRSLMKEAEEIAILGGRFAYRLIKLLFQVLISRQDKE
jgi:transcriptional regulator with XRE-family HTH domain